MIRILRWAQVTDENNNLIPLFYFIPTQEFLSFVAQRGMYNIPIVIEDTGGVYEGTHFVRIDKLTTFSPCNFSSSPNLVHVAFLSYCPFTIYPYQNGRFALENTFSLP